MSKAEDKLENNRLKYIDYTFKRHGIDPDSKEGQLIYYAYGHGYHQAEKDLELTWKDFVLIRLAFDATEANINLGSLKISPMTKEYYEEVLKLFKDSKHVK